MMSLYDIAAVCDDSSKSNFAVLVGTHDGRMLVPTYNWADHLAPHFRKVPGIKSFHHFRMSAGNPGIVHCFRTLDDRCPVEFNLLKGNGISSLPSIIDPSGLSRDRMNYLFNEIREFCASGSEDLVAPAPM